MLPFLVFQFQFWQSFWLSYRDEARRAAFDSGLTEPGAFALTHLKKLIPLMEEKAVEVCNTFDSAINYSQGIIDRKPALSSPPPRPLLLPKLTSQSSPPCPA